MTRRLSEANTGLLCLLGLTLLYHLFFFNRFFPIQEGWFSVYGRLLQGGAVPYRDFYLFLPPLYPLKIAALMDLFGDNLIVFRVYALLERLLLVAVIYRLYLKFASPRSAFLAAVFSVFLYASSSVDVVYSYYQTCLLLGILSAYSLLKAALNRERAVTFISFSGVLSGLAFMCKQSTGLFVAAAVPTMLWVLFSGASAPKRPRLISVYLAAFALSLSPFLLWLQYNGAFPAFVSQVFLGGVSSKGTLLGMLFGFLKITLHPKYLVWYAILGLAAFRLSKRNGGEEAPLYRFAWAALLISGVAAIVIPLFVRGVFRLPYLDYAFSYAKGIMINISFLAAVAYSLGSLVASFRRELTQREKVLCVLSGTSVAIMYAHGLSYALEEHAAFPAVGAVLCAVLEHKDKAVRVRNAAVAGLVFCFMFFAAAKKYSAPYGWWGWREPEIGAAVEVPSFPEGRGFRISRYTNVLVSDITSLIRAHTGPSDTIYTFPSIPLFYFLTGKYPVTFAKVHYFDVCPDGVAREDAARLRAAPPKVIVSLDFSERTWRFHEEVFRKGGRSGQREVLGFIREVTDPVKGNYRRLRSYLTPTGEHLNVWVRTGEAKAL